MGCLPERDLSSYAAGQPLDAELTTSPAPEGNGEADGGVVEARVSPLLVDAAVSTPPASVDAAPARPSARLLCRPECECELRDGRDFMLCDTLVTRAQAATRCQGAGGALVSIEDEALNTWLSQRMAQLGDDNYWTSGTDAEDEGVWRWGDGPVFYDATADAPAVSAFAPWDDNQPNDVDGEDCLRAVGGAWRDIDCADEMAYVCER